MYYTICYVQAVAPCTILVNLLSPILPLSSMRVRLVAALLTTAVLAMAAPGPGDLYEPGMNDHIKDDGHLLPR